MTNQKQTCEMLTLNACKSITAVAGANSKPLLGSTVKTVSIGVTVQSATFPPASRAHCNKRDLQLMPLIAVENSQLLWKQQLIV